MKIVQLENILCIWSGERLFCEQTIYLYFSPEVIFLNFENDEDYFYEDGTSFNKKYFEDIEWDVAARNLKGKISWPSENMLWNDKGNLRDENICENY